MAKYQAPRGTQDVMGTEAKKWQKLEQYIHELCYYYNYQEIRTPMFEHTEVFKRENDSSDMVNKEMYTFDDNGGRSITLKPEGTAGVIRSYVENKMYADADLPKKLYYIDSCFRYERPQKGRLRVFHQFGTEIIGNKNPLVDAECITLGYSFLRLLGLNEIKVLINTLGDEESRAAYRQALIDHFTPVIGTLCEDCQRRLEQNPLRILDCKEDANHEAMKTAPEIQDYLTDASKAYFDRVLDTLAKLGIPYEISPKLVRGLDYYTDTVFEVVSTSENAGSQSTIFGGGRYDKLVNYFGGPEQSGMGFGMGLERILLALEDEGIDILEPESLDIYFMPMGEEAQQTALLLSTIARSSGYSCDIDYQGRSMKAQFKAADRANSKIYAIIGEDELENNQVTLKRVKTKEQVTVSVYDMIQTIDDWAMEEAEEHEHHHHHDDCDCEDCNGECEDCDCEDCDHDEENCTCGHHHHS